MCHQTAMCCPHCHNVGVCVWPGYGKDWVICPRCQRRVRWTEVQAKYLVEDNEVGIPGTPKVPAFH
ncbi:MAG: hypothetical protein JSU87_14745 [Gemmatimonadota bacterium]|nr:MAG: hypothetical protein JSU87_14745 [Gemmatimonadota bacterium]